MKLINPGFTVVTPIEHMGMFMLKQIERAGRTCYQSQDDITDESAIKFVKMIIANGHHSVLEHEKVTVRVVCDRGVTHELVRHRIASYSQESTRYCNYSKGKYGSEISYILPPWGLDKDDVEMLEAIEAHYMKKIASGQTPQQARYFLPNGLKTEIVITMNLRQWRHFFNLRALGTTGKPHPQMLEVAVPMLEKFKELIPVVFDDLIIKENN